MYFVLLLQCFFDFLFICILTYCENAGSASASSAGAARPVLAWPVLARPVLARPVLARPVPARPVPARPVNPAISEIKFFRGLNLSLYANCCVDSESGSHLELTAIQIWFTPKINYPTI